MRSRNTRLEPDFLSGGKKKGDLRHKSVFCHYAAERASKIKGNRKINDELGAGERVTQYTARAGKWRPP